MVTAVGEWVYRSGVPWPVRDNRSEHESEVSRWNFTERRPRTISARRPRYSNVLNEAGIVATLRGGLHDAYPGTSGLGAIDVLVSEQDLPLAHDVISRADTVKMWI